MVDLLGLYCGFQEGRLEHRCLRAEESPRNMIDRFDIWSTVLTPFVLLNWFLAVVGLATFIFIYASRRFLFVKPSVQLFLVIHVLFQWPLALYSGFYEQWLPSPFELTILVHGFVLLGILGSLSWGERKARAIWNQLDETFSSDDLLASTRSLCVLLFAGTALVAAYLLFVPIDCTGIYALVFDPAYQPLARELSLKLLTNPVPRYSLSIVQSSIAPLMTGLVGATLLFGRGAGLRRVALLVILLLIVWFYAFIPGVKSTLVSLSLVLAAVYLWSQKLKINLLLFPVIIGLSLLPAVIVATVFSFELRRDDVRDIKTCFSRMDLTLPATADELTATLNFAPPEIPSEAAATESNFISGIAKKVSAQIASIAYRVGVVPLEVGGWYVHHFQSVGPIGIGGIPRLAKAIGVDPVDTPNLIGRKYAPIYYGHEVSATISATAGFIFSYYAYFGLWALPIALLCAWFLDIAILVLGFLIRPLALSVLAALSTTPLKFAESDYTAVWLTHGFGVILALGLLLSVLTRIGAIRGLNEGSAR